MNQEINRKLEDVVCKTVAAFANSQGGTLLIGVLDDGEIVGLGHDYASLGHIDRDKYELHLRNLLVQQLGGGLVAAKVKVAFPEVDGKEICQVDVGASAEPVIITVKDKNGLATQKFYVRSGNSSPELPLDELKAYWNARFPA